MANGRKHTTPRGGKALAARRKKVLTSGAPAKLRALRTPLRHAIVQALTRLGACTVRELADELGHEPASLYYHVHALEDAGIVVAAGRRSGSGRPEGVYSLVAERIVIDRTVTSKAFLSALSDLQMSTLRTTERELAASMAARGRSGTGDSTMLLRLASRLSPRDLARAKKMIHEVVEFLAENDDASVDETYSLTVAFVRTDG